MVDKQFTAEYTYWNFYNSSQGRKKHDILVDQLLETKLLMSSAPLPVSDNAVVYKYAALIIRNTDLDYPDENGTRIHEQNYFTDDELKAYKDAWQFAMDAVQYYSNGKLIIETDWLELEGTTLTGLKESVYKDFIDCRHLDPEEIEPRPDRLFEQITNTYDGIVFAWPRGNAASAYGGGFVVLPHERKTLERRYSILSLSNEPRICIHEFLHSFEGKFGTEPVHGPDNNLPVNFYGDDEIDWYGYLIESVGDWSPGKLID